MRERDEGIVPFVYGAPMGDYWPGIDMSTGLTFGVAKSMYVSSRGAKAVKYFEEVEKDQERELTKRIQAAIDEERRQTRRAIEAAAQTTKKEIEVAQLAA